MSDETLKMLSDSIINGEFETAKDLLSEMSYTQIQSLIYKISFDTESIMVYKFLEFMYETTNEIFYLECCVHVLCLDLTAVEGAYRLALYYQRKINKELGENVGNLEMMLFFNTIPEKLVTDSEAEIFANKLLNLDKNNNVAIDYFRNIRKNND
jgi:hypothetical protein